MKLGTIGRKANGGHLKQKTWDTRSGTEDRAVEGRKAHVSKRVNRMGCNYNLRHFVQ